MMCRFGYFARLLVVPISTKKSEVITNKLLGVSNEFGAQQKMDFLVRRRERIDLAEWTRAACGQTS